ncbi:MAG: elongation factor P [Candidatus Omnitrophica bacterium]|nr:elongation factor P [Candidatus Omnitrophota bacterium]
MKRSIDIRAGNLLLIDGRICKVEEVDVKGSAKAHKTVSLKMRGVIDGKYTEHTYHQEDKLEEADVVFRKALYSYKDGADFFFLDKETFESYAVAKDLIADRELFLKENGEYTVNLYEGDPISVSFPERLSVKVKSAPPGIKGQHDVTTFKEAILENGMKIDVPQFIETGDTIEVDTETGKYIDRVKT